ncbi:L-lactate permease [Corynebacterium sputi]|uniref:L-lactate permease n=1 Tax=Corynebacterium sputi TaxID=489915 RepID=UPI0004085A5E|nr:L-lactate permease [Corynebacterium sputi]
MTALLAAAPILVTIALLLTRLPAWAPPLAGIVSATVVGVWALGSSPASLYAASLTLLPTLIKVLAIIGAGIFLSRVMQHSGAQQRLADWLSRGGATVPAALMMAHGVVPFLESVTGFGVSIIIGMPLMMALGFPPVASAVMVLLGLLFISPWASMGPGTLVATELSGADLGDMGLASGMMMLPAFIVSGVFVGVIAARSITAITGPDTHSPRPSMGQVLGWAGVGTCSAVVLWLLTIGTNWLIGTPVAGAVATAIVTTGWLLYIRRGRLAPTPGHALAPYGALLVGTISGQVVGSWVGEGIFQDILESPATWAFFAALLGWAILPAPRSMYTAVPSETLRMWWTIGLPNALYISFGAVIAGGGLAEALATALMGLGVAYLFAAPFIGALSGYITASAASSNSMFGTTQVAAGAPLGVSSLWMMSIQNASSGWAVVSNPARVEIACQMIPADRRSGSTRALVFRIIIPAVLLTTTISGVACLLFLMLA